MDYGREFIIERILPDVVWESRRIGQECNKSERVASDCNTIAFFNVGDVQCSILGVPLLPGESLSLDGEKECIDRTEYDLRFEFPTVGIAPLVVVLRTFQNKVLASD